MPRVAGKSIVVAEIVFEAEALGDALSDLRAVWEALPARHGDRFRSLERKIEALFVAETTEAPRLHMMGDRVILAAPDVITALLVEARALGLLS